MPDLSSMMGVLEKTRQMGKLPAFGRGWKSYQSLFWRHRMAINDV